ncbi:MAG: cytochrome c maturation protein CcmE [Pseudomonadota bacterium]
MKSLKKKRRIQVIVLLAISLAISTGLIGYALRDGINFFRSPSQIALDPPKPGEVFRLGGLVEEGSLVRGEGETIRFNVTDGGAVVAVTYSGILPDLFSENEGVVGLGTYADGVFMATEILAKHDEQYMPREVIESLKEQGVYQEPGGS